MTDCEKRGCRAIHRYFLLDRDLAVDICKDCDRLLWVISRTDEMNSKEWKKAKETYARQKTGTD